MLATTIDTLHIPSLWYPVVQQIQAAAEPPKSFYLDHLGKSLYRQGASSTVCASPVPWPRIEQLGWSAVEALETHLRLRNFAEDWDAPGMEAYDDL